MKAFEKLKPCPFCGGQGGLVFEDVDYVGHEYAVQCNKCGIITEYYENPTIAIKHWNRRYTGLKDHKGREIYEDDIVKVVDDGEESFHVVKYMIDYDYPAFDLDPGLNVERAGVLWTLYRLRRYITCYWEYL